MTRTLYEVDVSGQGPYEVDEKLSGCNFRIQNGSKAKMFYANMMKVYEERPDNMVATVVIKEDASSVPDAESVPLPGLTDVKTVDDIIVNEDLSDGRATVMKRVGDKRNSRYFFFTDKPGKTSLCEFMLSLQDHNFIRMKPHVLLTLNGML